MAKRKKPQLRFDECPERCSGRGSNRQSALRQTIKDKMDTKSLEIAEGLGSLRYCTYCQAVYGALDREPGKPDGITRLGFFNNSIIGQGWHASMELYF